MKTIIGATIIEEEKALMLVNDKGGYIHIDLPNEASFEKAKEFIEDSVWNIEPNKKKKLFGKTTYVTTVDAELNNFYELKKHMSECRFEMEVKQ